MSTRQRKIDELTRQINRYRPGACPLRFYRARRDLIEHGVAETVLFQPGGGRLPKHPRGMNR